MSKLKVLATEAGGKCPKSGIFCGCFDIMCVCNLKSHNMYPKLDEYIKRTLAFNWLYMILLCMYLLYRILTM